MDVFTRAKRSVVMAAIRGRGNQSTEQAFAIHLRASKLRGWRRHSNSVAGTPDFFFGNAKLAIFVDGCFWHGCPTCFTAPKTNVAFWRRKIQLNRLRDRRVLCSLASEGIQVIRIWEHDVRRPGRRLSNVIRTIRRIVDTDARPLGQRRQKTRRS